MQSNAKKNISAEIDISKYEFMIYQLIMQQAELGRLYLDDSISFRHLSSYLVSDKKWRKKNALLKKLGNKKLVMPVDQLLDQAEVELEYLIQSINNSIINGDAKGLKRKTVAR